MGGDSNGHESWKWTGLGFEFTGVVAVFLYLGYEADRYWDIEPWGILSGGFIGVVGGLYWLAKEGLRAMGESGPSDVNRAKFRKPDDTSGPKS